MQSEITILCTGDLHLGRHPSKIPEGMDSQRLSPRSVWQSIVDEAIQSDVDAVLISGDVIDRENRYFEAFGAFEAGATRLNEAEIPTIVVTGNHDFDTLPTLVRDLDLDYLRLLGDDGNWERFTLTNDDEPVLHIDGWSFPTEHVFESPLNEYDLDTPAEPTIGLLHGDYDTIDSQYAPIGPAELDGHPPDTWVLGHIHSPGIVHDTDPLVYYPGSPQPLDPGEPGFHGPWTLTIQPNGNVAIAQQPGATVRYESLAVDISGLDDVKSVPAEIKSTVDEFVTRDVETAGLELLLARVELTGRSSLHGDLLQARGDIIDQSDFQSGSLPVRIERLTLNTKPDIDLEELADGSSPVAYLAELLLALDDESIDEEYPNLIEAVTDSIQKVQSANPYTPLHQAARLDDPETETAVPVLEQEARALLDELLEQQEGEPA